MILFFSHNTMIRSSPAYLKKIMVFELGGLSDLATS
jgi:hypothetical protein